MSSLPISSPAAQGVLAEGVQKFLDALEEAPEVEPHSLVVLRHGSMVVAGWWWPYSAERPQLLYSLSKIFTATAAGLAVADGRLRLDDPVIDYFPELRPKLTGRPGPSLCSSATSPRCAPGTPKTLRHRCSTPASRTLCSTSCSCPLNKSRGAFFVTTSQRLTPWRPSSSGSQAKLWPITYKNASSTNWGHAS